MRRLISNNPLSGLRLFASVLLLVLTPALPASVMAQAARSVQQGDLLEQLTVVTENGGQYAFQVEVARTDEQRARGLLAPVPHGEISSMVDQHTTGVKMTIASGHD